MHLNTDENNTTLHNKTKSTFFKRFLAPKVPTPSRQKIPLKLIDWIAMIGISIFYAFFAFSNLGNTYAPKTEEIIPYNTSLEISSKDGSQISTIYWYLMDKHNLAEEKLLFSLEAKNNSDSEWTYIQDFTMEDVFSWECISLLTPATSIRITNITQYDLSDIGFKNDIGDIITINGDHIAFDACIGEIVLLDLNSNIIAPANITDSPALFDETNTFPPSVTHLSNCYFDEIYYTVTAYEFIHGLTTYENTHPPLGKILIALGTCLFGTTPFGFRFIGTLFGVLMLPFMYLLGRNITKNRAFGAFISFLFAFDFMHFTQTRITTIDVYVTFFIIVMYYFMEQYINTSFYDTKLKKTWLPLGACGIAFGFGISCKWTGFYAGAGLAILFFYHLLLRYREYRYALLSPHEASNGISHKHIMDSFKLNTGKTIIFCLYSFLVLPFIIYLFSYLPFIDSQNMDASLFEKMLANQKHMFSYHSNVEFTHYYTSKWYEWPIMVRPMLYYSNKVGLISRQAINAFGNPLVWWAGIPAFIYMLYLSFIKKKTEASFLCIAYLTQYLPWIFVSRLTFIYHYFPCVPFLALMIGYSFLQLQEKAISKKIIDEKSFYCLLIIYAAATYGIFQLFLPVLSGQEISIPYVTDYLKWIKDWVLVVP